MNKFLTIFAAASVAVVALAGCSGKKTQSDVTEETTPTSGGEYTYVGTLPGADVAGIRYELTLKADHRTADKGSYELTQTYESETNPVVDKTHGDFEVLKGTPDNADAAYVRFIPKDVAQGAVVDTLYMLCTNDTTLTLVGRDLTPSVTGLNYNLTLQK